MVRREHEPRPSLSNTGESNSEYRRRTMKKLHHRHSWFAGIVVVSLVAGCSDNSGGDGFGGTGPLPESGLIRVNGAAQKGPFLKGSEVLVSTLSERGVPATDTILSEIRDDTGTFEFSTVAPGPVMISADGYYFNEVTGSLSQGRLLLRSVYNAMADTQQQTFVNVLTHLSYKRILTLMSQGIAIAEATHQAESEVLQALSAVLPVSDITDFTQLSIYNSDTRYALGNAYVLALSATVIEAAILRQQQNPQSSVDSQLTALLNELSDDIGDDGTVDVLGYPNPYLADDQIGTMAPASSGIPSTIIGDLVIAARNIRPDQVRSNLENRALLAVGQVVPVAELDLFLDTDGDGMVNAQDTDDDNDGVSDANDVSPYVYTEAPVLLPTDATMGLPSNTPFTLQWTTTEFATQIEVQVAKDASFGEIMLSRLSTDYTFSASFKQGIYFIRARAQNALGDWGPWSAVVQIPVDVFAKTYIENDTSDDALAMIQTSDDGFLVTGSTNSGGPDQPFSSIDAFVQKIDSLGNVQWRTVIATVDHERASDPFELADGGYLVIVGRVDAASGRTRYYVTKIDAQGTAEWSNYITDGSYQIDRSAFYVADIDGVVVGYSKRLSDIIANERPRPDFVPAMTKFGLDGEVLWVYQFDDSQNLYDTITGLWTNNGSYTITGNTNVALPQYDIRIPNHLFIANLSADRSELSVIEAPLDLYAYGLVAQPTSDGGYVLLGGGRDTTYAMYSHLFKIGPAGDLAYNGFMYGECDFFTDCWFQTPSVYPLDDRILYGGSISPSGNGQLGLVEISGDSGAVISRRTYDPPPGPSDSLKHWLRRFIPTRDGGVAILGDVVDNNTLPRGFVLIKTDAQRNALHQMIDGGAFEF